MEGKTVLRPCDHHKELSSAELNNFPMDEIEQYTNCPIHGKEFLIEERKPGQGDMFVYTCGGRIGPNETATTSRIVRVVYDRTEEEIEELKRQWLNDPVFDIEDAEGFEAHYDELLIFHLKTDIQYLERKVEEAQVFKEALRDFIGITVDHANNSVTPKE